MPEAEQLVHLGRAGCEHDHRQIARCGLAPHLAQDLEAVLAGQHEVEDERVRARREQALETLVPVGEGCDLEARALEVVAHEVANLLLVLDHQHQAGHGSSEARVAAPSPRSRRLRAVAHMTSVTEH